MITSRRTLLKQTSLALGSVLAPPCFKSAWGQSAGSAPAGSGLPGIPWGAVYFRKTAPPSEDWDRDYAQAAKDGMNAFRHWFMWSAIEIAPGKYEWSEYDRQLDLAAEHGLTTIVGEILSVAPQWAFTMYPEAQVQTPDGRKVGPHYNISAAVGGWPGLSPDHPEVLERSEEFLRQLVLRYREHPALGGYDIWNELNHLGDVGGSWSEASADRFREWLLVKYGDLKTLGEAWYRYSFTSWDDVRIPRILGRYPDGIDLGLFRIDNAMRIFQRRVELIRQLDPHHPIVNHTIPMATIDRVYPGTYPDGGSYPVFRATKLVDITGFSGGGNHDDRYRLRWGHWAKMDITRSAARGKPFWAAEMTVGNSWRMKSLKKRDEGRMTTGDDVRFYTLMNLAGGVRGFFCPRWRPLLDGPAFGALAYYAMDGSPTERSEVGAEMISWMSQPGNAALLAARPVSSDIGILVIPESQIHTYVSHDSADYYEDSVFGAYQAMLFNNLQVDFVPVDDIPANLKVLYLPFPVMLPSGTARSLREWVASGGILISEGCPGYFGDHGKAGTTQPNLGMDELFGARQSFVQFTPDLLEELTIQMEDGSKVDAGIYLQAYEPTTGKALAKYDDGQIAAVENQFGKGKTQLIGSFPGFRCRRSLSEQNRVWFAKTFAWSGREQAVTSSNARLIARLQVNKDDGSTFLWIVNAARETIKGQFHIASRYGEFTQIDVVRGAAVELQDDGAITATLPARDVCIVKLA